MAIPSTSKIHTTSCTSQPKTYYSYEDYKVKLGNIDNYRVRERVGRGRYSEVFKGYSIPLNNSVAIKVLKPVRDKKISREILVLQTLQHKNIIKMLDTVRDSDSQTYSIVFEYIEHKDTRHILSNMNRVEFEYYMGQVLSALKYAHSHGIIHRDIKPQNLTINTSSRLVKIIDWGLAEFYIPNNEYNVKVASRFYKAPELLCNYVYYNYSLDMWSFGCILAEYYLDRSPYFCGSDNLNQLVVIGDELGREDLLGYVKKYEVCIPEGVVISTQKRKDFTTGLDNNIAKIINNLLTYDHNERLTAEECLDMYYGEKLSAYDE